MAYKFIEANTANYKKGRGASIKYIAIHYTANKGDTAAGNCNYFKNKVTKTSAHYFVDEKEIMQSVKDGDTAWAVGAAKPYAGTKPAFWNKCVNSNSISIEMCNSMTWNDKVVANTIKLVKELMTKYKVPIGNVIRHYDVTGKTCPISMINKNEANWTKFKNMLKPPAVTPPKPVVPPAPAKPATPVPPAEKTFLVKVISTTLNVRDKASMTGKIVKKLKKGEVYTISETSGAWYKLKSGNEWISSLFVKKI